MPQTAFDDTSDMYWSSAKHFVINKIEVTQLLLREKRIHFESILKSKVWIRFYAHLPSLTKALAFCVTNQFS